MKTKGIKEAKRLVKANLPIGAIVHLKKQNPGMLLGEAKAVVDNFKNEKKKTSNT